MENPIWNSYEVDPARSPVAGVLAVSRGRAEWVVMGGMYDQDQPFWTIFEPPQSPLYSGFPRTMVHFGQLVDPHIVVLEWVSAQRGSLSSPSAPPNRSFGVDLRARSAVWTTFGPTKSPLCSGFPRKMVRFGPLLDPHIAVLERVSAQRGSLSTTFGPHKSQFWSGCTSKTSCFYHL